MVRERLSVEEAKSFWFGDDPTLSTIMTIGEVWAMPKVEVERGLLYLDSLKAARTIGAAQEVFDKFQVDKNRPKLLPRHIVNFHDEPDYLLEFLESNSDLVSNSSTKGDQNLSLLNNSQLFDLCRDLPFVLSDCSVYRDDMDVLVTIGQPSLWTDEWMPKEIVETLGIPDTGYGIDYEPAEFVYLNIDKFEEEFNKYGIGVIHQDPELFELAGFT